ncbi:MULTISPECIES: hypothetical protein [unclassified Streptomyces]|uniref:Uncharacterized protein n=1 Tax=Streptomyces sp. NBC_00060 TaxID=2975636 RepID=A0AAU2GUH0_9ACTN
MRLRTTISASVLAVGIVFGGAATALAHDNDDHCREHSYGQDHGRDYGRDHDRDHGRDYGRDHDRDHGRDYGRDHDRDKGYGRDHGRDHDDKYGRGHGEDGGYKKSCHTAAGSNANKGSYYEHNCDSEGWSKKGHHETY